MTGKQAEATLCIIADLQERYDQSEQMRKMWYEECQKLNDEIAKLKDELEKIKEDARNDYHE